jgi:hypothetical protein
MTGHLTAAAADERIEELRAVARKQRDRERRQRKTARRAPLGGVRRLRRAFEH